MNAPRPPSIELIQGPSTPTAAPARARHRWPLFFSVLLLSLAIGALLVYSRPPVYRASASVLTVKPADVDRRSAEADTEHVAIQARLLQSDGLLERLQQRLAADGTAPIDVQALRQMLSIVDVPETNLLELRAEGAEPLQLQQVVNAWTETYEIFRAEEIEAATGRTTSEIEAQQQELTTLLEQARGELQAFREAHDIVDLDRSENASPAQLRGINRSLSKARERLVEAQAREAAVQSAIVKGETVVPSEQKADINRQKLALERARVRLADLREKYTDQYLDRDPVLRSLPGEVQLMERELARALQLARTTVLDEARQEVEAAALSVQSLENQLEAHEQKVQAFNENYKQFKVLEDNLARYEGLYADSAERLAQIQAQGFRKYPQIQVVEWARVPESPIGPDYPRDMLIAAGISLALALFVTWLYEYLGGRAQEPQAPFVGVRINPDPQLRSPDVDQAGHLDRPEEASRSALTAPLPAGPQVLTDAAIRALLNECGRPALAHAALLLSGVSPYEMPLLNAASFDAASGVIRVSGAAQRDIPLAAPVWPLLAGITDLPEDERCALSVAELNDRLVRAARDAGLDAPAGVDAQALWFSYAAYLVGEGVALDALVSRVGMIATTQREALAALAPEGEPASSAANVDWTHPALRT